MFSVQSLDQIDVVEIVTAINSQICDKLSMLKGHNAFVAISSLQIKRECFMFAKHWAVGLQLYILYVRAYKDKEDLMHRLCIITQ